ncbi:MAG: hypothetical protein AAGI71_02080 [Bacteroidota bacterium]
MEDLLYYLALFIIYLVFQVVGGKKKKKKKPVPIESPSPVESMEPMSAEEAERAVQRQEQMEQIGRELGDILGIEIPVPKRPPQPSRPIPGPVPVRTQVPQRTNMLRSANVADTEYHAPSPLGHLGHEHFKKPPVRRVHGRRTKSLIERLQRLDTAREAVLLNEILGTPKSKR